MKRKKERKKETKLIHSLITSIYQVWDSGMYTHSCVRFDFHRDADRRFRNGWANSCSLESFQTVGNPIQRGTLFDSIFKYCNVLQLVKHLSLTRPLNQKKNVKSNLFQQRSMPLKYSSMEKPKSPAKQKKPPVMGHLAVASCRRSAPSSDQTPNSVLPTPSSDGRPNHANSEIALMSPVI